MVDWNVMQGDGIDLIDRMASQCHIILMNICQNIKQDLIIAWQYLGANFLNQHQDAY